MDKEWKELIDEAMKPVERFRLARKRIVADILAEAENELLTDGYYDVLAHSIIRDLEYKEKLRRGHESLMMRNVVDRISQQLTREENPSLLQSDTSTETSPGNEQNLSQYCHDTQQSKTRPTSAKFDHSNDQVPPFFQKFPK